MSVERIQPEGLTKPPTYSHVVKTGRTVYIAGQVSQDERGQLVGRGDFAAQATQVFENLKRALAATGATFDNLVKVNIYLTDPRYRETLNEVRAKYIAGALPASTLVVVAGLALPEYLLEIEAVAQLD